MPKKGFKITQYDRENLEITEEQFKLLVEYGARTTLERAFLSFMIDSFSRRIVAEIIRFEDIDLLNNRFKKYEAFKGSQGKNKKKIQKLLKEGIITKVKFKDKEEYKILATGYFTNRTKNYLIELKDTYKSGRIFRRNAEAKEAMTPKALNDMWNRCIIRFNKRVDEWKLNPELKIKHPDPEKRITIHDIRRARPANFEPNTYEDTQVMQRMLTHMDIATTFKYYAVMKAKKMQLKLEKGLYKEENMIKNNFENVLMKEGYNPE